MLKFLINLKTGYTIDERYPCGDPCPNCGGQVYHVKEDDYVCFCTSALCTFRDTTRLPKGQSWRDSRKQYVREKFERCYSFGGAIHLKDNDKYSWIHHPIIIMQDVLDYKYKIREWEGNDPFDGSYSKETTVYKSYSSLDDMINDGWCPQS